MKAKSRRTGLIWLSVFLIVASLELAVFAVAKNYQQAHKSRPLSPGVSFSANYAEELGVNWQEAYSAITSELGVKRLRLMSYWNVHQPEPTITSFESLDWQFNEAEKVGAKVSLAIGLRQPRWPECHYPAWVKGVDESEKQKALLNYLKTTVERYKNHAAIESWQLENEVSNNSFGECPLFNRDFLKTEYELVKRHDPMHPVIINVGNQSGIPLRGPLGDKVGLSLYRNVHSNVFGGFYLRYKFLPADWYSLRASLIEKLHNRPVFIHELQMEPWGPKPTVQLSKSEQYQSMSPQIMQQTFSYAKQTGIREVYLWGAEWWYWQKTQGNNEVWETAKSLLN